MTAALVIAGGFQVLAQDKSEEVKTELLSLDELAGSAALWTMTNEQFAKKYVAEKKKEKDKEKKEAKEAGVVVVTPEKEKEKKEAEEAKAAARPENKYRVFEWLSAAKNAARYQGTSSSFSIIGKEVKRKKRQAMIGDVEVGETIVRFADGKVKTVEFSIFNRGDNGKLRKPAFEKKLKSAATFVNSRSGARGEKPTGRTASAARADRMIWRGKEAYYQLEYSFQRSAGIQGFVAEFIKLKVVPASAGSIMARVAKSKLADRRSLRDRVVKRPTGDVLIDSVPMVDQGAKGYCAVASAERVLRYYGLEVDQHEMAQIAGSSAFGGTSSEKMTEALERTAGRLKVRIRKLYEAFEEYDEFERLLKKYNRAAKKNPEATVFPIVKGRWWPYQALYHDGDPTAMKTALADGPKYDRFKKDIAENVDVGVPLLWSLYLGVFPEKGIPQAAGGHMRVITGYNRKNDELIYSDSWGAGHEEKRMKFDEAFTMTMGLRILIPSR